MSPSIHYFGDYELLEEIARGGMGVVYRARQTSLNRVVAVKMILAGQLASENEVKRFRTEAEAAANLQHPNIVAIHEVGEHEGRHYFSMDYVEGKNLSELVREGPLPAGKAALLVKLIAEAIHYAHQRGTLHRDLKPPNVLMDANGQPRITDFGLAKLTKVDSGVTQSGAVMGSPSYMPPEQASGRHDRVGPASDVYSIGAILYELLTGRAPFRAESPLATLQQVLSEEPVSPSKLNPNVPLDLQTICLKCLEKGPEKRYVSARELAEELGRFLNHEPIHARPASALRKAWGWSVRNPWAITGAGTLVLLGVLGVAYGLWEQLRQVEWQRSPGRPPPSPSSGAGFFLVLSVFLGLAAAFEATCLDYMRRRKNLPINRLQVALGWIAGLSWMGFGLGLVRLVIWGHIWDRGERSGGTLAIKALFGLAFAWAGALYLWHVLRNQQVVLFGSEGSAKKSSRSVEVLNQKTLTMVGAVIWIVLWLLSWLAVSPASYDEFVKSHPGYSYDLMRNSFFFAAVGVWVWASQSRGCLWIKPQPGMLVLICILSSIMAGMCFVTLGPLVFVQAALAGLVGGLIQARFARLKVTVTTNQASAVEDQLDPLFDLIHWNEWTLSWIVGGMVVIVLVICSGVLSGLSKHSGHFLFIAAISTTCVPLVVAWSTKPKARSELLLLASVLVVGSLAVTSNMVFRTRELPFGTAFAALAAGYLTGTVLTLVWKLRQKIS